MFFVIFQIFIILSYLLILVMSVDICKVIFKINLCLGKRHMTSFTRILIFIAFIFFLLIKIYTLLLELDDTFFLYKNPISYLEHVCFLVAFGLFIGVFHRRIMGIFKFNHKNDKINKSLNSNERD